MDYLNKIPEYKKLTERKKIFIRNYLDDPKRHGKNAALKSAYTEKSATSKASQILALPQIKKLIEKYDNLFAADNADLKDRIIK